MASGCELTSHTHMLTSHTHTLAPIHKFTHTKAPIHTHMHPCMYACTNAHKQKRPWPDRRRLRPGRKVARSYLKVQTHSQEWELAGCCLLVEGEKLGLVLSLIAAWQVTPGGRDTLWSAPFLPWSVL